MKNFLNKTLELMDDTYCVRTLLMIVWIVAAIIFSTFNVACHFLGHGDLTYYWDGATAVALISAVSNTKAVWTVLGKQFRKEDIDKEEK